MERRTHRVPVKSDLFQGNPKVMGSNPIPGTPLFSARMLTDSTKKVNEEAV